MGEDISCRLLCHKPSKLMTWDEANSQHVIQMIQHEYFVHLLESYYYYIYIYMLQEIMFCIVCILDFFQVDR